MTALIVAALLAAAAGLTGAMALGWRLRRGRTMLRSPEEAAQAAEAAIPGFSVRDAVIGEDGRAGLVLGDDGRVVVVTAAGRAGTVPWAALRQTYDGVVVETGMRRLGEVMLKGVHALDVRRLGMSADEQLGSA